MPASSEPPRRTRAGVVSSFLDGWTRAWRAPVPVLGWLAVTIAAASPLLATDPLRGVSQAVLGAALATAGWHATWATGLARVANGASLLFYVAIWTLVSGGLLDRLARQRPLRTYQFFGISAVYAIRFLRLAIIVWPAYWALFRWLGHWLTGGIHERIAFGALFGLVSLVADFAKVRAVVEDRRSMIGALAASVRFVRRRFVRLAGLYGLNLGILAVLTMTGPPAGAGSATGSLLLAQLYLLAHVWARLAFMASQVAFFQGELAHARYAAAPLPHWPESPSAEALERLRD